MKSERSGNMLLSSFIAGTHVVPGPARMPWTQAGSGGVLDIAEADEGVVAQAVGSARRAFQAQRPSPLTVRLQHLQSLGDALAQEAATLAHIISEDVGKPIRIARGEVARGLQFVEACMSELPHLGGEVIPLDAVSAGVGRVGYTRRFPYGVVAAITPFNAPVNLLVQKLAPALAAGNACVAKPAPASLRTALHLAEAAIAAGLPPGLLNVLAGDKAAALALAGHPDVGAVSFTGGVQAGEALARATGVRRFVSELGSSAANVVLADADLQSAAAKIAAAAFEASGQQCISAQRVIVEAPVYDAFAARFVAAAEAMRVGPAGDEQTDIGPLVSEVSADRIMALCEDAIARGARYRLAPRREGLILSPAILEGLTPSARLWYEEVFGPVAVLIRADDARHALELANDSPFGLQGAVFTGSLAHAFRFAESFDVGALWVNEASRFRLDMYPFGGMKLSGTGREGVRYAIEELSQLKFTGIAWQ
ncbi:MAG: aldehyde dehydrogenase family protein [Pigmentiphaga sp.]|uniref:aldehyde dehydrogenase family protein n=1 Tax=Pigmentiphaga sp. TaxID=1977564 RepID=UPI0029A108D4|nr:aldehyde dehydrogenase family protein [Pigmentiphaga sp.]MDX3906413.1 aldehyde dehydrogenase family protein [Pigmentiphaga sp.]